jgi:hypothetical protein
MDEAKHNTAAQLKLSPFGSTAHSNIRLSPQSVVRIFQLLVNNALSGEVEENRSRRKPNRGR